VYAITDRQRIVKVDGGLHGLLLAALRHEHEAAKDDE
jgi:hypothetical protein